MRDERETNAILEQLREEIRFDPIDGQFWWKRQSKNKRRKMNAPIFRETSRTLTVKFRGIAYSAHRLAWAFTHGHWPPADMHVDHINGDWTDNRPENLRLATPSQNQYNRLAHNNKSGVHGVCWCKQTQKWRAQIHINGKQTSIGRYADIKDAERARIAAEKRYVGEFSPRLSRSQSNKEG